MATKKRSYNPHVCHRLQSFWMRYWLMSPFQLKRSKILDLFSVDLGYDFQTREIFCISLNEDVKEKDDCN